MPSNRSSMKHYLKLSMKAKFIVHEAVVYKYFIFTNLAVCSAIQIGISNDTPVHDLAIWDTFFWNFLSYLHMRDLKTYPWTCCSHFEICHFMIIPGPFAYFSEKRSSQKIREVTITPFGLVLQGRYIKAISWANLIRCVSQ